MVSPRLTSRQPSPKSRSVTLATADGCDFALERAIGRTGDVAAQRHPVVARRLGHRRESRQALGDRAVDVAPAERLRRRGEDRDLRGAGRPRRRVALQVRRQRAIDDARRARDPGQHRRAVGHLRHPLRADEARDLDMAEAAAGQEVDERDLLRRRDRPRLVLQPVARADLVDRHAITHPRAPAPAGACRRSPARPPRPAPRAILPSRGAVSACSIFIASSTTSTSPRATIAPAAAASCFDQPGHRRPDLVAAAMRLRPGGQRIGHAERRAPRRPRRPSPRPRPPPPRTGAARPSIATASSPPCHAVTATLRPSTRNRPGPSVSTRDRVHLARRLQPQAPR